MNCDDFLDRLQRHLDDRVRPESDRELVRHTRQCERCCGLLDVWRQVSAVMPASSAVAQVSNASSVTSGESNRRGRKIAMALSGLAVAAMWILFETRHGDGILPTQSRNSSSPVASLTPSDRAAVASSNLAEADADVDPQQWWHQVQRRDWVGQTMPTVQSVREGVAPIGRTLMRAVTILTLGGNTHAS